MSMNLCLASGNAYKAREFQHLADAGPLRGALRIRTAREVCGAMPQVDEDTGTFAGNARKKARALWEKLRDAPSGTGCQPVGLEVARAASPCGSGGMGDSAVGSGGMGDSPMQMAQFTQTHGLAARATQSTQSHGLAARVTQSIQSHGLAARATQSTQSHGLAARATQSTQSSQANPRAGSPCHLDGWWILSDDSGLCVDALGGAPGVESAYYAGPQGDSAANLAKLIDALRDMPDNNRAAHFVCVLVLITPEGEEHIFEARSPGRLARAPRGGAGFGYDPLFIPDGHEQTFAELSDTLKNTLSHRARAWKQLEAFLATCAPSGSRRSSGRNALA